jgi:hypothetical protein
MATAHPVLPVKYLPFDRYKVAAEIGDLDPDALKAAAESAREAYRGDERFQQLTALNHMANAMGFPRFNGFKAQWAGRFPRFMEENGLRVRRDVLAETTVDAAVRLGYREVADRLFASGKPLPRRIFVGAAAEYWDLMSVAASRPEMKVVSVVWPARRGTPFDAAESVPFDPSIPPHSFAVLTRDGELRMGDLPYFSNLVGDQLCDPASGEAVPLLYRLDDRERRRLDGAADILRTLLPACPSGWVDVVPYNDRLCFLRAPDGGYEFVFKGMRSRPFTRDLAGDPRLWADRFEMDEDEQFAVSLYFEYDGWEERDRHLAEHGFHDGGGENHRYPRGDAILRERLKRTGWFRPERRTAPPAPGFRVATCGDRRLCFSPLVTVAEFRRFMREHVGYARRRRRIRGVEDWEPVNHPSDGNLPAAVAWHDAKAYARWFGQSNGLPTRLAAEGEYLPLAEGLAPGEVSPDDLAAAFDRPLGRFFDPDGLPFDGHPDYMAPSEFDHWGFRYDPSAVEWAESKTGLRVIRSAWFGEWLAPKGAAINCLYLCSQHAVGSAADVMVAAERDRFCPESTGKYKSMKIGFRLVYETDGRA